MSSPRIELASPLAEPIRQFLAAKRALNRRFDTEERTLRLLDRYLVERSIIQLVDVTSAVIEAFLTSRPRRHPRSYNHLLGVLRRLFDWMVDQGFSSICRKPADSSRSRPPCRTTTGRSTEVQRIQRSSPFSMDLGCVSVRLRG